MLAKSCLDLIRNQGSFISRIRFRKHTIIAKPIASKFEDKDGTIAVNVYIPIEKLLMTFRAKLDTNLRNVVDDNDDLKVFLECACEGNAICSTCHIIVDPKFVPIVPPPEEMELDILDLVASFETNSRLGCQINFTPECDGITFIVPEKVNNLL
jgi:ferredoxin